MKRSFQKRLLAYVFGMMVAVIVVLSSVYYVRSSQLFKEEIASHTTHEIDASALYIEQYVSGLKHTTQALVSSLEVKRFAGDTTVPQEGVEHWLETILESNEHFVTLLLVTKDGRIVSNDATDDMTTSSDMMQEQWYQEALHQGMQPVFTASRQQKGRIVLSISQEIVDNSGENLGVVRLDIDDQALEKYVKELSLGQEGYAFIVNDAGEILYHPDSEVFRSMEKQVSATKIAQSPMDSMVGDHAFVHKANIPDTDWKVVGVTSYSPLVAYSWQIFALILTIALICFIICTGLTMALVKKWFHPLRKLEATMQAVEKGNTELRAHEDGFVEFKQLSMHFNRMLDQLHLLMEETKEKEQQARTFELQVLTNQINPHFLYNTLDMIIWMAEFGEQERVVNVTKALGMYFRLALNGGKDTIDLRLEVEHVRQYLYIQQERYGEQLSYDIQVEEAVPSLTVPKLILQPLVENAIQHGIKESGRPGRILLTVKVVFPYIEISIWDNGVGFNPQQVKSGVGLENVKQRLALYFGNRQEMTIHSEPNHFTQITIRIKQEEETT